jgi:hypothetical protein
VQVVISARDDVMSRFGKQLAKLSEGRAKSLMSKALNTEGNKGRTQVRRALMAQTGIKSHQISKAIRTIKAGPGHLQYKIEGTGNETNISMFGLKVRWKKVASIKGRKGMRVQEVTASPWNRTRTFPGAFSIGKFGGKVYKRTTGDRGPLKPLFGPDVARELVKEKTRAAFEDIAPKVATEVGRLIGLELSGVKLGRG